MAEKNIPEIHAEGTISEEDSQTTVVRLQASLSFPMPFGLLGVSTNPGSLSGSRHSKEQSVLNTLGRCRTRQNLTAASLPKIRRNLARAWRLVLASQIDEALRAIEQIERQLDDVPSASARPFRATTRLLRAASLAFQDDSLAALAIAVSHLEETGPDQDHHAASTLCRLGFWRLGEYCSFYALPRHPPRPRWSKSRAVSATLDLSIEAAVALDHLQIATAKRLASDASTIAETALKGVGGLAALPACIGAQVLYEEGYLDEADVILREWLPVINAEGPIECALRAYLVLTRIATHRTRLDFAALLLREAEDLGGRRGWPRLVAASLAERAVLLLQAGQAEEARRSLEQLDRYAEAHRAGSGYVASEVARYRTLTRWRVSWVESPSGDAVAALRQLYHHALETREFYVACGLAIELAQMLSIVGESEEADALVLQTIRAGATAGLYQVFLEGGAELGALLTRAYTRAAASDSTDRDILPFVGSLLSRWKVRGAGDLSTQLNSRGGNPLTAREQDILAMISQGHSNKSIARTLRISPETVKWHVKRIFSKLAASNRTEALGRARLLGLL
jgi:ATP/maltotriose-dependent transcriptional regulator MalT